MLLYNYSASFTLHLNICTWHNTTKIPILLFELERKLYCRLKKDLLWANFVVKLLKLKEENLMLYLAVSNCIINNSEKFYVCILKNWKKDSKWYWKKNSQGPQYCFKIFMYSRSWRVFFSKSLKEDPQLIFFLQKLIVHILWTSKIYPTSHRPKMNMLNIVKQLSVH